MLNTMSAEYPRYSAYRPSSRTTQLITVTGLRAVVFPFPSLRSCTLVLANSSGYVIKASTPLAILPQRKGSSFDEVAWR